MDDIKTWWEIPSIVHFCNVFSEFYNGICPLSINEFEEAVEENKFMLTDLAIRFVKICSSYDRKTNSWKMIMKNHIPINCLDCKIECSQEFIKCFNDLTRKQKIEALYTLCHIVLDHEHIQDKISYKPKLWNTLNVKPIGYDLNKSVYWYFGTTRLYREDFENTLDLSNNSSMMHDSQNVSNTSDSSNIDVHKNFLIEPYPSGIFGSGKWNTICDDNNSWHSFADTIEYSKNVNIRSLHRSICNIITNLPQMKTKMAYYKYIIPLPERRLRLRSQYNNNELLFSNFDVNEHEQYVLRQNVSNKQAETNLKYNKTVFDQNIVTSQSANKNKQINTLNNGTAFKLQSNNANIIKTTNCNDNQLKIRQSCFERVARINIERFDQENVKKN